MSLRTTSRNISVICALVGAMLTSALIAHHAAAQPAVAAAPPSTPAPDGNPGIELVDGLGNGGQPDDVPRELVIGDARFLFDRVVPRSRQELVQVAQEQEAIAYATTEQGPFAAIYLSVPNRSEDQLARYLPEGVGSSDAACPAEAADYERLDAGGTLYAFAGNETDLAADSLQEAGDNNGEPVYSDLDSAQPYPELFFASGEGLLRFVLLGDDGRPASIAQSLAFNGAEFAFDSDATDAVDPASLTKVGCSTTFPVYAPVDTADGNVTQLYVLAGTRLYRFAGEGAPTDEAAEPPATTTTTTSTTTTQPPTTTTTTTEPPTTTSTSTTTTEPPTTTTTTTEPPTTTSTSTTTTEPPTTTTTTTTTEPPTTTSTSTTTTEPPTTTSTSTTTTELPTTTSTSTTTTEPPTTTSTSTTTTEPPTTTSTSTTTTEPPTTTSTSTTTTEPPTTTTEPPTTTSTSGIEPTAASTVIAVITCSGDPGELNAQGIPAHLPTRIQLDGLAYVFDSAEAANAVGTLTRIGCIGPFESASTDQDDQAQVIYLRSIGSGGASEQVYRFEVAQTYEIEFQVTERPQLITTADQRYRLGQVWQPSVYSSTSVSLFVQDPVNPAPEVIYALNVSQTVVGDAIGEYRLPGETTQPSTGVTAAAEQAGLNPDLTINGRLYLLVDVYTPTGTTSNGFMTLFGTTTEEAPEILLGRDSRQLELFIFLLDTLAENGG